MIVDDFWAKGLSGFLDKVYPHCIRVPFPLGVKWENGKDVSYRIDPVVEELSGMKKAREEGKDGTYLDCSAVRAPYDCVILFHNKPERAILVVTRVKDNPTQEELVEQWAMALILDHPEGLFPLCAMAGVNASNQLVTMAGDGSGGGWRPTFERACMSVKRQLTDDIEELLWYKEVIQSLKFKVDDNQVPFIPFDMAMTVYVTFKLLGAKNIQEDRIDQPAKLQAVRKKRGKAPLFSWHELSFQGSPILAANRAHNHTGDKLPVHWVRGHFKEYTAANPLFGHITGRFWWQPHLAGRDKERFVEKTYVVGKDKPAKELL